MTDWRLSFSIDSIAAVPGGWRLEGEPDYHPRQWARPGDRFDRACQEHGRNERTVALVVVELTESYVIVSGEGGDVLRPDDIVFGERPAEDVRTDQDLAQVLGLPAVAAGAGPDWSQVETTLGVTLPGDYKAFVGAYGGGLVDDHLTVCGPADLLEHNSYAQECLRLDSAAPDDLISWGHTGNGDFLFWHVKPGTAPDDWPVVLKERGPYWERFATGFAGTVKGLLTGGIQSEYLSSWLGGPHTYGR